MIFVYPIFKTVNVFDDNNHVVEYLVFNQDDMFFDAYTNFPYELLNASMVVIQNCKEVLHIETELVNHMDSIIDADIVLYCANSKLLSFDITNAIPQRQLSHHVAKAKQILLSLKSSYNEAYLGLYKMMMTVLLNYYYIECNKVYVVTDNQSGYLDTWFNMYNKTFRPTNRYGGVNFTALSKKDNTRNKIQSRYGDEGLILSMDFTAHNIYLIGGLLEYDFAGENPYTHLAKHYTGNLSYSDVKIKTFFNIFDTVDDNLVGVPFFDNLQNYIDNLHLEFQQNGFIYTEKFKRKTNFFYTEDEINNIPRHTLFNHYIQAYETEYNNIIIYKLLQRIANTDIKCMLYIYDELIFDIKKTDVPQLLKVLSDIVDIPYKIKVGETYADMFNIDNFKTNKV